MEILDLDDYLALWTEERHSLSVLPPVPPSFSKRDLIRSYHSEAPFLAR